MRRGSTYIVALDDTSQTVEGVLRFIIYGRAERLYNTGEGLLCGIESHL